MEENYYQLLGVPSTATKSEINSAFRQKSLIYHPDKNDDPGAADMFHKISNAKEVLTDPQKKQEYDRLLEEEQLRDDYARRREYQWKLFQEALRRHMQEEARSRVQLAQNQNNMADALRNRSFLILPVSIACVIVLGLYIIYSEKPSDVGSFVKDYIQEPIIITGRIIAIDIGTTYSRVGVFQDGQVKIISNCQGGLHTPSVVSFNAHCEHEIGDLANKQLVANPKNTVFHLKRLIRRESSHSYIKKHLLPFSILESKALPQINITCKMSSETYTVEEIMAIILRQLKDDVENYLGTSVQHVVLTVPAFSSDVQRRAIKDAGTIAGLNVVRLINEPSATIIYHGLKTSQSMRNILIFSLGGGFLDVSLFTVSGSVFEVQATSGNTRLGGDDFNIAVTNHIIEIIKNYTDKTTLLYSKSTVQKIQREVEKAKRSLSHQSVVLLKFESLLEQGMDIQQILTINKFKQLNQHLLKALSEPIIKVLRDADITKVEVDEVVLVGGGTKIPGVKETVQKFFIGKEIIETDNSHLAAINGATLLAAALGKERNAPEFVIKDVNPHTLGIPLSDGTTRNMINRNSFLPLTGRNGFAKISGETESTVLICEGESYLTKHNTILASYKLTGLAAPAQILYVVIEIDVNGIFKVSANHVGKYYNKWVNVYNDDQHILTKSDFKQMAIKVEKLVKRQRKMKQRLRACDTLEKHVYFLQSDIIKLGDDIDDIDKDNLYAFLTEVLMWLDEHQDVRKLFYVKKKQELEDLFEETFKKYDNVRNPMSNLGVEKESNDKESITHKEEL